jgi:hypothetical protein
MKRQILLLIAIAATGFSCEKKSEPVDSGTDDARLRPEVAAARKGMSPSPTLEPARSSPTPSP